MNIKDVPTIQSIIANMNRDADTLEDMGYSGLCQHIDMIILDLEHEIEQAVRSGPLVERLRR